MMESDEPRNMAWHRNDVGLHRFQFVLCPSARWSPDECPPERTQRSSGRGPREWSRESGAVETRSGGSGHRGPRSRDAGCVGRERLVVHTGCPLIPPAGTFSPHGVEKDPIQASARPADGSFPITPQRQQPRVPPLPRIDSRHTERTRPRERVGVRAKSPLSSFRLCCSTLSASGRPRTMPALRRGCQTARFNRTSADDTHRPAPGLPCASVSVRSPAEKTRRAGVAALHRVRGSGTPRLGA
jgi:hypothetical protein